MRTETTLIMYKVYCNLLLTLLTCSIGELVYFYSNLRVLPYHLFCITEPVSIYSVSVAQLYMYVICAQSSSVLDNEIRL